MSSPILSPQIGDSVYLATLFANLHIHGIISDLDTPDQVSASLEVSGSNALLSLGVLQGPRGPAGSNAPLLKLQFQIFDSPDDLPTNLVDDDVDIGRYWIVREFDEDGNPIGSKAYVWYGTHFEWFPMGTAGPAGPVPIISWTIELLDPDDPDEHDEIIQLGDNFHPSLLLRIKAPRGPTGPSTNISSAPDVDFSTPPEVGDVLTFNGTDWVALPIGTIVPKFFTMPEAAFTDVPIAIGTVVQIGSFLIPTMEWDAVPVVSGHVRITGVEADIDPFIIGAQVRLGHPTSGTLVARGFGNVSTYVNLTPHASTTATPNDAITPDNGRAVIPANTTVATNRTLYISAFNDGVAGIYNFAKRGAQLSIQMIPV